MRFLDRDAELARHRRERVPARFRPGPRAARRRLHVLVEERDRAQLRGQRAPTGQEPEAPLDLHGGQLVELAEGAGKLRREGRFAYLEPSPQRQQRPVLAGQGGAVHHAGYTARMTEREAPELQSELDSLDRELVALVERRAEVATQLGRIRASDGPSPRPVPPELVTQALEGARGILPRDVLTKIVRRVATACAPLLEPARIAFVSTAGEGGRAAARGRFGDGAQLAACPTIGAALAAVVEGHAVFAVVPYEAPPAGIVDETVQALLAGELRVLACFDARADVGDDATSPDSEPPSDPTSAMMRYAVIGTRPTRRTGNDRTALVFTLPDDAPGALHDVLQAFKECDVNLTHIHSRPAKTSGAWSYLFFVEMYGHTTDRAVITAIDGAKRSTRFVRVLGSYARE